MIFPLIQRHRPGLCVFCRGTGKATGEHLIKKSVLKEWQPRPALIMPNPKLKGLPRNAQGPSSKAYHFDARVCANCNNSLFQTADRSFDEANAHLQAASGSTREVKGVFEGLSDHTKEGLFRYFSRLMTLQIAQKGGPTFRVLAKHAINQFEQNRIWLDIQSTHDIPNEEVGVDPIGQLAHGGLAVFVDQKAHRPLRFHSYLTIPPVHYAYYFETQWRERLEIRTFHRSFLGFCRSFRLEPKRLEVGKAFDKLYGR